jgi:hypothetical protein
MSTTSLSFETIFRNVEATRLLEDALQVYFAQLVFQTKNRIRVNGIFFI